MATSAGASTDDTNISGSFCSILWIGYEETDVPELFYFYNEGYNLRLSQNDPTTIEALCDLSKRCKGTSTILQDLTGDSSNGNAASSAYPTFIFHSMDASTVVREVACYTIILHTPVTSEERVLLDIIDMVTLISFSRQTPTHGKLLATVNGYYGYRFHKCCSQVCKEKLVSPPSEGFNENAAPLLNSLLFRMFEDTANMRLLLRGVHPITLPPDIITPVLVSATVLGDLQKLFSAPAGCILRNGRAILSSLGTFITNFVCIISACLRTDNNYEVFPLFFPLFEDRFEKAKLCSTKKPSSASVEDSDTAAKLSDARKPTRHDKHHACTQSSRGQNQSDGETTRNMSNTADEDNTSIHPDTRMSEKTVESKSDCKYDSTMFTTLASDFSCDEADGRFFYKLLMIHKGCMTLCLMFSGSAELFLTLNQFRAIRTTLELLDNKLSLAPMTPQLFPYATNTSVEVTSFDVTTPISLPSYEKADIQGVDGLGNVRSVVGMSKRVQILDGKIHELVASRPQSCECDRTRGQLSTASSYRQGVALYVSDDNELFSKPSNRDALFKANSGLLDGGLKELHLIDDVPPPCCIAVNSSIGSVEASFGANLEPNRSLSDTILEMDSKSEAHIHVSTVPSSNK